MDTPKPMKPLSERQARNCEEAREPVCRCRCRGRLHGAKRGGGVGDTPREFFEMLSEDDPHYVPSAEKVAEARRARLEQKRKEHAERMARRYERLAQASVSDQIFW